MPVVDALTVRGHVSPCKQTHRVALCDVVRVRLARDPGYASSCQHGCRRRKSHAFLLRRTTMTTYQDRDRSPRHVAIIMDGNGRWAQRRGLPRIAGHRAGVAPVRETVQASSEMGIGALTLFAFSSENWQRPSEEVKMLWELFAVVIDDELPALHDDGIRLRFIGDRRGVSLALQDRIHHAEHLTSHNPGLQLCLALNYGGRWDITRAAQKLARQVADGALRPDRITAETVGAAMELADVPDPDLLIRTGGEKRISNFLIWQLAYSELYFTDTLWPNFRRPEYERALAWYGGRERRYGLTGEQIRATA